MTIVDTSVWIDHLNRKNKDLSLMLSEGMVLIHPFIIWRASAWPHEESL